MRAVVQRVSEAEVTVDGETIGAIGNGLMVLVGIHCDDTEKEMEYIARKIFGLRIFEDDEGTMNRSVSDAGGGVLLVPQFTLYGDARKGQRPSYIAAMPPGKATDFFDRFVELYRKKYGPAETGRFGADMRVSLLNRGPVTILLDSGKNFY